MTGQHAYEAYLEWWDTRGVYGRTWDELTDSQRAAWAAAEQAVRDRYEHPPQDEVENTEEKP